jgi:Zn-dependent metalloprotease
MYYHVNVYHDHIKEYLGFSGMDYRIVSTVKVGSGYDNAYFDGTNMSFGEGEHIFTTLPFTAM